MNEDQDKEKRFVTAVRHELDRRAAALDDLTLTRLRSARRRALDAAARPRRGLMIAGLATVTLSAALVVVQMLTPAAITLPAAGLEQFDLLSENEGLDLYGDLEFYRWLAAQADAS